MKSRPSCATIQLPRHGTRRPASLRRLILAALLVAGAMPGLGCGGDDPPAPISDVCVEFAPNQAPAAGTLTPVMVEDSTCEKIFIDLIATGVDDVFSMDTVLTYDSTVVRFRGWSNSNSFLRSDGAQVATLINENAIGEITIGTSRVLVDTGVDIVGSETLLRLEFDIGRDTSATGDVALRQDCLLGSEDPPQPRPGVTCVGGTLTVR